MTLISYELISHTHRKLPRSSIMSTAKLLPRRPAAAAAAAASSARLFSSSSYRLSSTYAHLSHELPARRLPPIYSDLAPGNSHTLGISLSSFLPASWTTSSATTALPANALGAPALPRASPTLELPPAHHLVYFNPVIPADKLLPDGTDPLQSPGAPFVRRMWAGGYVRFAGGEGEKKEGPVVLDGQRWVCVEGIRDVAVKGKEGEEKVFVGIERRIGRALEGEGGEHGGAEEEERVRRRLWTEREEDWGEASLVERRNIVFMRERTPEEAKVEVKKARGKMLFRRCLLHMSITFAFRPWCVPRSFGMLTLIPTYSPESPRLHANSHAHTISPLPLQCSHL